MNLKPTNRELIKKVRGLEHEVAKIKETEYRLKKSEAFLNSIIQQSPYAIWISDDMGTLIDINPACCELVNITEEEVVGKYNLFRDNILEEKGYMPLVKSVFEQGETAKFTIEYNTSLLKDIKYEKTASLVLDVTISPIKDEAGNVTNAVIQHKDITKQRQTEKALRHAAMEWQTTFDATKDAMWLLDKNHKILRSNITGKQIFTGQGNNIIGKYCWEVVHRTKAPIPECPVIRAKKELRRHSIQLQLNDRWLEVTADPILESNGKYAGAVHIVSDITDRKHYEDALRESRRQLATLMNNLPGMVYRCKNDPDWSMEFISDGCQPLTGYRPEELIDNAMISYGELIHQEDRQKVWDNISESIKNKKPFQLNYRIICANKDMKWVMEQGQGVYGAGDDIVALEGFITDITKYKLALEEREELQVQLIQAQKMEAIGTLAGGIAHDFNNILSPIMIHSEIAMMELPPDSPVQHNLRHLYRSGERARDLVKQILTFARKRKENRVPLKVSLIVKETIKFLRATIPSTIDIQYDFKTEKDTVLADLTQLNQIVMNLCTNAAHVMRDKGGSLLVSMNDEFIKLEDLRHFDNLIPGHYLRLSIKDTGPGIEPNVIDKIFEPYFTTKKIGEGTGLGLSVIHGIIKDYGGNISVESEIGKGATFHVLLPIIEGGMAQDAEPKTEVPGGKERILFIDDEKAAVDAAKAMLERLGYKVTTRIDSIEALELFRNQPEEFDLIITDQTMPNMTGKELAAQLMSIRSNIPIILCTGYSDQIDAIKAREMGISTFVMKPIIARDMAVTIRDVLNNK